MRLLILCTLLCGCEMSSQDVIERLDECKKAGLEYDVYRMFGDSKVIDIQCVPVSYMHQQEIYNKSKEQSK